MPGGEDFKTQKSRTGLPSGNWPRSVGRTIYQKEVSSTAYAFVQMGFLGLSDA